jgi:hypothetical protein
MAVGFDPALKMFYRPATAVPEPGFAPGYLGELPTALGLTATPTEGSNMSSRSGRQSCGRQSDSSSQNMRMNPPDSPSTPSNDLFEDTPLAGLAQQPEDQLSRLERRLERHTIAVYDDTRQLLEIANNSGTDRETRAKVRELLERHMRELQESIQNSLPYK